MKKISSVISFISASVVYLFASSGVYAESICPPSSSQFHNLCNLSLNNSSDLVSRIVTILLVLAVILALLFLLIGSVRWITSGGDKGKVDEARKAIVASIVGLILAFVAYFILNIILFLFTGQTSTNFSIPTLVGN